MTWFDEYNKDVNERQERLIQGIPTLIPFASFPRLSQKVPGIIPGDTLIVTGNTGEGKSRFVRSILKDTIKFCNSHGLEVEIIINSLEESKEKFIVSSLASALYNKYKIKTNYFELANYSTSAMSTDLKTKIETCKDEVNLLQKYVTLVHIANPYGFFVYTLKRLFDTGKFYNGNKQITDFETVKANSNNWNRYVPNNPHRILIVVSDTIDAYIAENQKTKYETILNFSKFFTRKILGLQCNVISIFVQQQAPDLERIQTNFKGKTELDKLKPGNDTLLSCKATSQDSALIFGLFNPVKYGETSYLGYDKLDTLKDGDFRSLVILKTREGEKTTDNEVPTIAYFSRDEFVELPLPTETDKLKQYYK